MAQSSAIQFKFYYGEQELKLDSPYTYLKSEISFSDLKFYISDIHLGGEKGTYFKPTKKHHLVDIMDPSSCQITFLENSIATSISFNLGIDSLTNVSGAMPGNLDPINGMYWTWQTGYINFKLEGRSPICKTRKNRFQYHLGGYAYPYNSQQSVKLNCSKRNKVIVRLDIHEILKKMDIQKQSIIMTPCLEAVNASTIISNSFKIEN